MEIYNMTIRESELAFREQQMRDAETGLLGSLSPHQFYGWNKLPEDIRKAAVQLHFNDPFKYPNQFHLGNIMNTFLKGNFGKGKDEYPNLMSDIEQIE